jgi:hypothetical protein
MIQTPYFLTERNFAGWSEGKRMRVVKTEGESNAGCEPFCFAVLVFAADVATPDVSMALCG